jgi:acetyl esterase/lipase
VLAGIAVMVWGSAQDGPLAPFHSLFYFEILIVAGAVVGLLVGLATTVRGRGHDPRRRRVAAAILGTAGVLAVSLAGWAVTPGPGDPIVRESPDTLVAIATLDLPDPSAAGPYTVVATSYGSGRDRHRREYGDGVGWRTPTVDASAALPTRGDIPELYAGWFWGYDRARLPLNALVSYPSDATGPRPLVIIVHGNHAAADFSDPGYAYLGTHLASRGYVVASIDQNYLNGDALFDYAGAEIGVRAWLLLRHAALFADWTRTVGHPLEDRVDLDRVAFIGHSRGGEAAALASMMATDATTTPSGLPVIDDIGVRTVVAVAPSDGMHRGPGAPVRPRDIDYLVMQGARDGDLPGYSGIRTYHRVGFSDGTDHLKVALFSERANHGRFNSVWDDSDAGPQPSWLLDRGSLLSAAEQQRLAKTVVTAFLARSVDGAMEYEALFREPRSGRDWLPDDVIQTHWETSARIVVETGLGAADERTIQATGFDRVAGLDPTLRDGVPQADRAIALRWSGPASVTIPVDVDGIGRVGGGTSLVFSMAPWVDPGQPVDPLIELVSRDGCTLSVRLSTVSASRPLLASRLWKIDGAGDRYLPSERQVLGAERFMQTHELPLAALLASVPDADSTDLKAVRLRFDTPGSLLLDDIGFETTVRPTAD